MKADLGKFTSTSLTNDVVGQAEGLQSALIDEHLGEELCAFCIDFVGVKTDVSQDLIFHEGVLELFKAWYNQIAAI